MRFGILGATEARRADGSVVPVRGPRLRALLARLLVEPGRAVSVERLIDDLYGHPAPAGVANALQSQVSRLRRALPDCPVELRPDGYRLDVDPDQVDVHRFEHLAREGARALASGDHHTAADRLGEALSLWRGPALADVVAPFAPGQTVRLEEARLAVTEDLAESRLVLGQAAALVPRLRELVAAHPLRERLRALLIRALYAEGAHAEALAVFEEGRRRLADQLGVDPSPELAAAYLAVLRREPPAPANAVPVPGPAASARPGSVVPVPLASFVGREDELRRVGELLTGSRLVMVTGPGGVGKTRLAVEAALRLADDVRLVEFDRVTTGAEVPQAVLTALGLRDGSLRQATGPDPAERLLAALADQRLLLLFDNCEHVVTDVARLAARLLQGCPGLRILATSRQALGITGEALCPLPGLATPPPDTPTTDARDYAAVRLFVVRGRDVAPGFSLDETNVADVVRICRMLDGLPLAIELAAARLRVLTPAQVAARLDDRFRLLTHGSRTAQPRHQTLRAVVGWSWDLLDEAEQTHARRLTVFSGGASLTAVEAVCGVPADDALELLTSLVDKSFVGSNAGRFWMLETIRAFAAERLTAAGEEEQLWRAHARYFVALAETADPHLRRAEQREWLDRLDADRDNLHTALRRAVAASDWDTALRMVSALSFYWWLRGLRGEATRVVHQLRSRLGTRPPAGREEEFLLCELLESLGCRERIGFARRHAPWWGDRLPRQPFLFYLLAIASGPPSNDLDELLAMVEGMQRRAADPWIQALSQVGAGMLLAMAGATQRAQSLLTDALAGFRALGDRWGSMVALSAVADVAGVDGQRTAALWDEALELAEQLGSIMDMAELLFSRGRAMLRPGGALDRAEADFTRALALARRAGAPEHAAAARYGLAEAARRRGDLSTARELAEQALAECPTGWFTAETTRASIYLCLGRIAEATGDLPAARQRYRCAVSTSRPWWNSPEAAEASTALRRLGTGGA